ncbi:hypothetical protein DDP54_02850 [Cellulomonas sp. WB94]|nr:hypothetical protein DDP54_02850 [Cellulomonas sp. WB94]
MVSSATCAGPLDWGDFTLGDTTVMRKPNVGYDFGSWAIALARFPDIASAENVVLANDSLVGPFASISKLFAAFHSSPADVWGLTETLQFSRHLQSFFVGYRGGVLRDEPLARFWRDIRHFDDKNDVIHRHEIGLGRLLFSEGYTVDAAFPAGQVVDAADNPTIIGWRTLLERGMPLVKRELVRSPHLAEDGADIGAEVRRRYGTDVAEWL